MIIDENIIKKSGLILRKLMRDSNMLSYMGHDLLDIVVGKFEKNINISEDDVVKFIIKQSLSSMVEKREISEVDRLMICGHIDLDTFFYNAKSYIDKNFIPTAVINKVDIVLCKNYHDFKMTEFGIQKIVEVKRDKGLRDIWTEDYIRRFRDTVSFRTDEDLINLMREYGDGVSNGRIYTIDVKNISIDDERLSIESFEDFNFEEILFYDFEKEKEK